MAIYKLVGILNDKKVRQKYDEMEEIATKERATSIIDK